jgi:hypothetical protein
MRKLTIVYHHAGGGHHSAALALKATLTTQENPWQVTLLDIQELLDHLDLVRRATGLRIQDTYNLILRKGWTRITPQLLIVLKGTIRVYHGAIVHELRTYWAQEPADLVLSVIPHFNREIAESLRYGSATTPFVTLITDLADYPPHFWIEKESQYVIVGTDRARDQALAIGHRPDHIFLTSGMILKPRFHEEIKVDCMAERKRLGLEPHCPTGIVLFGGHGSHVMVDITKKLDAADCGVQLILVCGHNLELAAELKSLKTKKPIAVVGFVENVEYYMVLADFFIGKPGPARSARHCSCTCPSSLSATPRPCRKSAITRNGLRKKVTESSCPVFKGLRPESASCFRTRTSPDSVATSAHTPTVRSLKCL